MLADIPGLIEGAAEGAGLGHEFLAHVERCSMLVHLVDLAPLEGDPVGDYETVRGGARGLRGRARAAAGAGRPLEARPAPGRARSSARWREWRRAARRRGRSACSPVSSATGEGLEELRRRILAEIPSRAPRARGTGGAARRIRGRAPRLPARRARAATGSSARTTAPSASPAAASSCCSSATTPATRRRSPTSSSG